MTSSSPNPNSRPAVASWIDRYNDENVDAEEIRETVEKIGGWLEAFIGPDHAQAAMRALIESLAETDEDSTSGVSWRAALRNSAGSIDWPSCTAALTDLFAYGAGGVISTEFDKREAERTRLLEHAAQALSLLPSAWGHENSIRRTITLAQARAKLDGGDEDLSCGEDITLEEIALLGGLAMQTVRNAASNGALGRVINKKVGWDKARTWLESRDSFEPSRWKDPDDDQHTSDTQFVETDEKEEEYYFVPKDKDGNPFLPTLAKPLRNLNGKSGYTIGAKGHERDIENYYEALADLNKMATPRWRRPNDDGIRGIVSAPSNRAFERIRKSDLDRMIAEAQAAV